MAIKRPKRSLLAKGSAPNKTLFVNSVALDGGVNNGEQPITLADQDILLWPSQQVQESQILDFFQYQYGQLYEGYLTVFTLPGHHTFWYSTQHYEQAVAKCVELSAQFNVYAGVGVRGEKVDGRGTGNNVTWLPGFWADIDCLGGIHKEKNLPSKQEALSLLADLPLRQSILIDTGGGFQARWLCPLYVNDDNREEIQSWLRRFHRSLARVFKSHGYTLDNVSDVARVLRVPGTFNYKDPKNPRPVTSITDLSQPVPIYSLHDIQDTVQRLEERYPTVHQFMSTPSSSGSIHHSPGVGQVKFDAAKILSGCAFLKHCADDAVNLPEPHWFCAANVFAFAENGPQVFHEISRPYPGYNPTETDAKLNHARENGISKPMSCEAIQEKCGDDHCMGCALYGKGKSPVSFGTVSATNKMLTSEAQKVVEAAILKAEEERFPAPILNEDVVGALAILRKAPVEWSIVKAKIQRLPSAARPGIRELENAIKQLSRPKHLHVVHEGATALLETALPDVPTSGLVIPQSWLINEKGIWNVIEDQVPNLVCSSPAILIRRLQQVGTDSEKVELALYRDHRWKTIIVERSLIASQTNILQLADRGLLVNSGNAKALVKFLAAFEAVNMASLPLASLAEHMGWVGKENFLPGLPGDVVTDFPMDHGYVEKGSLEHWLKFVNVYRQYPIARFALSASFAAPLLRVLGGRVFLLHMYGGSKAGKTAALHLALSVWGDPERLVANFNATRVGLELLATFNNDLPVGIDERQIVGDKQGFVDSVVYLLGGGKGKLRGTKQGKVQRTGTWKNIVISTGEEPLSNDQSREGIKTRAIELYGKPIPKEEEAASVYGQVALQHGTAGPEFIRRLVELRKSGEIDQTYAHIKSDLSEKAGNSNISSHLSSVAIVCTADYYVSTWLIACDPQLSLKEAVALGEHILQGLETAQQADEATRAMEYFQSWFASHRLAFDTGHQHEDFGVLSENEIRVFSHRFNVAMEERGFSPERVKRDWAEREWIRTITKGGKQRYTVPVRISTLQGEVQCVAVDRRIVLGEMLLTKLEKDKLNLREASSKPLRVGQH